MHIDFTSYKKTAKEVRAIEKEYKWVSRCSKCGARLSKYGGMLDGHFPHDDSYSVCAKCIDGE